MSAFQHASVSPLMRDSPRRVQCLSAPLSVEVIELNFPRISRLRLPSALLCCGERLSDYRTIRKDVKKKWMVLKVRDSSYAQARRRFKCAAVCLALFESEPRRWRLRKFVCDPSSRTMSCMQVRFPPGSPPPPDSDHSS